MRSFIVLTLCIGLFGCATTKTDYIPIVAPPVDLEKPPILACYSLKKGDKAPVVFNALIESIQQQRLYIDYLLKTHSA